MIPIYAQDRDYSGYNVLAVDDIPLNILLVQKMLKRFNFKLRTASGGQQALDMVTQEKPDLILLDLMMPGIDGRSNPPAQGKPGNRRYPNHYPECAELPGRRGERIQRRGQRLYHEAHHHGKTAQLRG